MKYSISFIIPVYNEKKGIKTVLTELIEYVEKKISKENSEIIVIDDGSTDGTSKILENFSDKVKIIKNTRNRGYGYSIKKGLKLANFEYIGLIDADCTYPIEEFDKLLKKLPADMVVGARIGDDVNIPIARRPAKKILNMLANYLVDYKIPDLNSGMRIFKKDLALKFFSLYPDAFSFTTTITLAFISNDYEVIFVPINYKERVGKSKINPFTAMQHFLITIIRTILYFNPLKVFLPLSLFFFFAAVIVLLESWLIEGKIRDATIIILLMTSFQSAAMGFLADLINKRH